MRTMCPATATRTSAIMGTGIDAISPCPNNLNDSSVAKTACPSLETKVRPRAALNMPRVAIKGFRLATETRNPFISPVATPVSTPTRMARKGGKPRLTIDDTPMIPASAATEPTERSIPAVIMTSVMPTPMTAVTAA